MGQRTFNWLRPFRKSHDKKQPPHTFSTPLSAPSSPPLPQNASHFFYSRRSSSNPDMTNVSDASSSIPYHAAPFETFSHYTHQPLAKAHRRERSNPNLANPAYHPHPAPQPHQQGPRRVAFATHFASNSSTPNLASSISDAAAPDRNTPFSNHPPQDPLNPPPSHLDFSRPPRQSITSDFNDDMASTSFEMSGPNSVASALDNFVPHRPDDRQPSFVPPLASDLAAQAQMRFSATTPEVSSIENLLSAHPFHPDLHTTQESAHGRYATNTMAQGRPTRFIFRRRTRSSRTDDDNLNPGNAGHAGPGRRGMRGMRHEETPVHVDDEYFGATQHDDRRRNSDLSRGEEVLLRFLRNTLGPKAQNLAVRLMNKTPITSSTNFSYVIHQGTEDSDLEIIRRDLTSGRLYSSGVRLIGGGWCNLLLGDRFTAGSSTRQRHELTYRRSSCSCINCRVRTADLLQRQRESLSPGETLSDSDSNGLSAELLSTMSSNSRTPTHSAMANFVVKYRLPSTVDLKKIGASSSTRELEIGTVVRLNYRASAKLKFTEDVRELFGHHAYTGPITHEEVYRRVTTIGVHYYLYNKGKKERKVYIQGELIRLPVQVGVVKLGTQPMYFDELGATFCLLRKQIMSIYVGEIVLEGNSLGSFIKTGIHYYIGFGEERGVCPVYPNKTLGKARKLGINELLLHHHMVEDLEVRCI
eukprot:GFKZ01011759.1.p1 GENE.GFKZ01011759.1~~GFKZ01011759.1.p1  ORF type:complete len:731 (-),score=83.28 GFKZ01011759.1:964-3054(-)